MTEALRLFLVVQALGFADVSHRPVRRRVRRPDRLAAHGRAAQPGRARDRRGGRRRRAPPRLWHPLPEATAIALLDRVISVFSIIVFGSIAYAISHEAARPRPPSRWSPKRPDSGPRRHRRPSDARAGPSCVAARVRTHAQARASIAVPHPRLSTEAYLRHGGPDASDPCDHRRHPPLPPPSPTCSGGTGPVRTGDTGQVPGFRIIRGIKAPSERDPAARGLP